MTRHWFHQSSPPKAFAHCARALLAKAAFVVTVLLVTAVSWAQTSSATDTRTVTLLYEQPNTVIAPSDFTVSGTSAIGNSTLYKSSAKTVEFVFADDTADLFADVVQVGTSSTDAADPYDVGLWRNAASSGLKFGIIDAEGSDDDSSFQSFTRDSSSWYTVNLTGETSPANDSTVLQDYGTGVHTHDIKFAIQQELNGPETNFSEDIIVRFTVADGF